MTAPVSGETPATLTADATPAVTHRDVWFCEKTYRNVPVVPNIDAAILTAIETGGSLRMDHWHICETTHCRAGWAITLAGHEGTKLESREGPYRAGALIYRASRPGQDHPDFFCRNDEALADLRACAAQQVQA